MTPRSFIDSVISGIENSKVRTSPAGNVASDPVTNLMPPSEMSLQRAANVSIFCAPRKVKINGRSVWYLGDRWGTARGAQGAFINIGQFSSAMIIDCDGSPVVWQFDFVTKDEQRV